MNLAEVRRAEFEPYLKQTFHISVGEEVAFDADLIEVSTVGETRGPNGRRAFSLVFRGPGELLIEQTICQVEHGELGAMDLFLVPIGPDEEGMKYEAVFT